MHTPGGLQDVTIINESGLYSLILTSRKPAAKRVQEMGHLRGHPVRIIDRDGNPWFVLADVCRVLELENSSRVASRLDDDERDTLHNSKGIADPQVQALTIVNESGLYSLILTSRKGVISTDTLVG